jgi:hypothetical protein
MTGKVIDSSATGLLILILPFAVLIVLLFKVWPLLLALFIISISFSVWQQYQWKQWSKQVNPYFNELIKENQGCLTAVDLSMKANLSGSAARRYLDKKAEEFGAQRHVYEDKGTVYYFLTASALGSIFDESEPPLELESESFTSQSSKLFEPLKQKEAIPSKSEPSTSDVPEPLESTVEEESNPSESVALTGEVEEDLEPLAQQKQEPRESLKQEEDLWADSPDKEQKASQSLIQAELAKRLDVHSSTVGKRKSDPDFSEWSQSRDPEGIPWEYSPDTKEFLPVQKKPESQG